MEQADEKVPVVEQCPLLAKQVEFGEFQAQFVVNVLQWGGGRRSVNGLRISFLFDSLYL